MSETRSLQPSASKSALLLQCAYPFRRPLPLDLGGEAADYGTAFHELLAMGVRYHFKPAGEPSKKTFGVIARKYDLFEPELEAHYKLAAPVLEAWLTGGNFWGINWLLKSQPLEVESSIGISAKGSRPIAPPTPGDHRYADLSENEVAGTADIRAFAPGYVMVMDHKTGAYGAEEFASPEALPQLLTLFAGTPLGPKDKAIAAIFHAPRGGDPIVYSAEVSRAAIREHRTVLFGQLSRVGDGSMRPGPACRYCPARDVCPTRDADFLNAITVAGGVLAKREPPSLVTPQKLGQLHQLREEILRFCEKSQDMTRAWVRENPSSIVERPDGKVLVLKDVERETLSKESVIAALGEKAGEKELERLRKLGCLKSTTRTEMRAERP